MKLFFPTFISNVKLKPYNLFAKSVLLNQCQSSITKFIWNKKINKKYPKSNILSIYLIKKLYHNQNINDINDTLLHI